MSNAASLAPMSPETFLENALRHVESVSIRRWATTEHNRPIFVQLAEGAIKKANGAPDVHLFAAYIVATAIGL